MLDSTPAQSPTTDAPPLADGAVYAGQESSKRALPAWLPPAVLLAAGIVFAVFIVRDLRHPMLGLGDTNQWLYQADYFSKHLDLVPRPRLEFLNDEAFYPYGVNNALRPWNFESCYFYAAARGLFGHGPWLQWYYLAATLLGAGLAYWIVGRECGAAWGLLAALALSFGNFNAVSRFPYHYGYGLVHWTTASILLDFVILRRVVRGVPLSLQLLLAKVACLVLAFGHDLGYVCGMALTSFTVTALWIVAIGCNRLGFSPAAWRGAALTFLADLRRSGSQRPWTAILLSLLVLVAFVLYLPLVGDLFAAVHSLDGDSVCAGSLTTSPLRMFIPIVPGIDGPVLRSWIPSDFVEEVFDLRPGIALVLGGLMALACAFFDRRIRATVVPFALLLILFAGFSADWSPLSALPWCAHARTNNRFSLALPVLLLVMILSVPWKRYRGHRMQVVLGAIVCMWAVEMCSAYAYLGQRTKYLIAPDSSFYEFNKTVSSAPGEAVMEWPFTVAGGNGVGIAELGIFYRFQDGSQALQAFHDKKIMGGYLGRLYPSQIEPLLNAGWHVLSLPDVLDMWRVEKQRRDFAAVEWAFLEEFFRKNDFCGIIVYVDLLPEETVQGFHQRFGPPLAATEFPPAGRLEFIPKPQQWAAEADRDAGRKVKLPLPHAVQRYCADGYWYFEFGYGTDTPLIGDWNGDGRDQIGVHRRDGQTGLFILDYNGSGSWEWPGDRAQAFADAGDTPLVGDWNGDGCDQVGVHRRRGDAGLFLLDQDGNGTFDDHDTVLEFGYGTDTPLVGDWNGDGRDQIGLYRRDGRAGLFILDQNGNGRWDSDDRFFQFGEAGDTPIIGDWNGDGLDQVGVRRAVGQAGLFILDQNGNGTFDDEDRSFERGVPSDRPLVGHWNGSRRDRIGLHRQVDETGRFIWN